MNLPQVITDLIQDHFDSAAYANCFPNPPRLLRKEKPRAEPKSNNGLKRQMKHSKRR